MSISSIHRSRSFSLSLSPSVNFRSRLFKVGSWTQSNISNLLNHSEQIETKSRKMSQGGFSEGTDSHIYRDKPAEDLNILNIILHEITEEKLQTRRNISDSKIMSLCGTYKFMTKSHQFEFIRTLAKAHAVDHEKVKSIACSVSESPCDDENMAKIFKTEEILKNALTPQYISLFKHIGRMENGVKFLVDFRTDILNCIAEAEADGAELIPLQQLNNNLRDLLSLWFSVGFLQLERITWKSPCELLQKISEYEAVHPVRSWTDIKRRVGPYRRCFVFLHSTMPGEPLVVLHTALCDDIPASLAGIVSARSRMSADLAAQSLMYNQTEETTNLRSAIFYSITSTQRGLQGIDLGNYLIKRVVRELQVEFPQMTQFATLSPIPGFKLWLLDKIKAAEKGQIELFTEEETENISGKLVGDVWFELRRVVKNNSWLDSAALSAALQGPLMRLCCQFLYSEKRRGFALCGVANFHLSNGAVLWRINWRADTSLRGMSNSCGMMVNYRYFLEDTEKNSQDYLSHQNMAISNQVKALLTPSDSVVVTSKI